MYIPVRSTYVLKYERVCVSAQGYTRKKTSDSVWERRRETIERGKRLN